MHFKYALIIYFNYFIIKIKKKTIKKSITFLIFYKFFQNCLLIVCRTGSLKEEKYKKRAKKLNEKTCYQGLTRRLWREGCDAKAMTWNMIRPKLSCLLVFLATKNFIIFAPHGELCKSELRESLILGHTSHLILNFGTKLVFECKN